MQLIGLSDALFGWLGLANQNVTFLNQTIEKTNEMFENSPFIVNLDSTHNQLIQTKFSLDFIDSSSFNISVKAEEKFPYNLIEENSSLKSLAQEIKNN